MNIGEAAAASGVSAKMIRYYEAIGLVSPADRTESGYRIYDGEALERLRFVRRARDLGFPIADIAALLALRDDRDRRSADVKRLALDHVAELRRRIAALEGMAASLQHLADACSGDQRPECPIIGSLGGATDATGAMTRALEGQLQS
jgi:MerR family gold-responsive transcriptional activator of gol and ges genes